MQQPDLARTAFTLAPVLRRRDGARITAVALHQRAGRVYLGLNTGALEEHRIVAAAAAGAAAGAAGAHHAAQPPAALLRLQAEKHLFPRAAISELAIVFGAARVAALSDDGQVLLTTLESFHLAPVPGARGAAAIAADPSGAFPPQLAVAVRLAKARCRVGVYDVIPGSATQSGHGALQKAQATIDAAVLQLVWVGTSLVAAIPGGYAVLRRSTARPHDGSSAAAAAAQWQVAVLADHLSAHPLVGALPRERQVVLAWDAGMALVAGEDGAAVAAPLQLPLPPVALAAAGLFIVAVCDDGIHVFDRTTSCEVQSIDWAHDDAHINLAHRMPAADDPGGGRIVLATSRDVLLLEPVALEQQVRETLKRKRYDQALALIDIAAAAAAQDAGAPGGPGATAAAAGAAAAEAEAARAAAAAAARHEGLVSPRSSDAGVPAPSPAPTPGPHWTEVALAQAGLLLLLDCDFDRAFAAFDRVPTAVFQPAQLFDLFPKYTDSWRGAAPRRTYWGLHGHQGLLPLPCIVEDWVELKRATGPRPGGAGTSGGAPGADDEGPLLDVEALIAKGAAAAAAYLGRARLRPGVAAAAGVDTLLLRLLADAGDAASLESLVTQPNAADAEVGGAALRSAGRWHALALMAAARGDAEEALGVWQSLSSGELQEAPCSSGAVATAGGGPAAAASVAVSAAAGALLDPTRAPAAAALRFLPWLLGASPEDARLVLAARRDLPPDAVLGLLQGRTDDLRWQYLQHLVHALGTPDAAIHTALGADLVEAAKAALAGLRRAVDAAAAAAAEEQAAAAAGGGEEQAAAEASTSGSGRAAGAPAAAAVAAQPPPPTFDELLRDVAARLPIAYAPNSAAAAGGPPGRAASLSLDGALGGPPGGSRRATWGRVGSRGERGGGGSALSSLEDPGHNYYYHYKPTAAFASVDGALAPAARLSAVSGQARGAGPGQQHLQQQRRRRETHTQPRHQHFAALGGDPIPKRSAGAAAALRRSASAQQEEPSTALAPAAAAAAKGDEEGPLVGLRVLPPGLGWAPPEDSEDEGSASGAEEEGGGGGGTVDDAGAIATAGAAAVGALRRAAPPVAAAARRLLALRCALAHHLQASLLYDPAALEAALAATPLWHERALVLSRRGDHGGALRVLALRAVEVDGAIAYCRATGGGQEAWLALLELFLRPPAGDEDGGSGSGSGSGGGSSERGGGGEPSPAPGPNYAAAVRVLNAQGARLNPLRLLQALDDEMPLALAHEALARMLGGVTHRRRTGQVVRALTRARHLAASADRAEQRAARVVVAEDTACRGCGRLLGTRVFFRYPSGVVLCGRCVGPEGRDGGSGGGGGAELGAAAGSAHGLAPPW